MRRSLLPAALVAAMAGSLVLAPVASAADGPKPLPLHQIKDLPLTAEEFGGDGDCPPVPNDKDGWHFVLPGSGKGESAVFTKLTVEFQPGGLQTITTFGPPSDKHAYATSEPGAKLISATAEVDGVVKQGWFNLSHTCAATETGGSTGETTTGGSTTGETTTGGSTTGETTTGGSTTGETTTGGSTTGETTTGETTTGETTTGGTTTGETTTGGTTTGETTTGGTTTGETTTGGTTAGSTSTGETTTGETTTGGSTTGGAGGDLAETGSGAPVGVLAAVAVALAGAGAFLVTRRRTVGRQG
ncbi:LPXTG cell wall anchor domain-containing protein [Streptomyces sp. Qhu_M48]|uniref:LPXTG cell wall anchor domain-containing protein n=1 Tax=Streptomyces sp. Qhu_M48 TaxID=3435889 RepID=UPI003F4F5520